MSGQKIKRFIAVHDNFYEDPEEVTKYAQAMNYHKPLREEGYRSTKVYHPSGIKKRIEKCIGLPITYWSKDPADGNGVFYYSFSHGEYREVPAVHTDEHWNDITVLIYLTPNLPSNCGTSFWRHRLTGIEDNPFLTDARNRGVSLRELRQILTKDARCRDKWEEIDRISYCYNRMVAFTSGMYHSATDHYGSLNKDGRVFQAFRIQVDWKNL